MFFVPLAVGPLDVQLLGRKEPVSAGRSYEFRCQSVGARPPPVITWWRGSIQLRENITNRVLNKKYLILLSSEKKYQEKSYTYI